MAKIKAVPSVVSTKETLKLFKEGSVHKKKDQKFKNTPAGKIALINGSKARNNKVQKEVVKQQNSSPTKSPSAKLGSLQAESQKKRQQQEEETQQQKKLNSSIKELVPKEEESDSEEDINEGITLEEDISIVQEDETDDEDDDDDEDEEEEEESSVAKILGASLADDTEEDDEDFEDSQEDDDSEDKEEGKQKENTEKELPRNKGIKMFEGLKPKDKNEGKPKDGKKQSESDSDKSSLAVANEDEDDSDDEDFEFEEAQADEDSEDIEDEEEDDDDDDDDDEEEDDDEDEDEEEEEEDNALGIHTLLGNSIAEDDEDDEDFDSSAENDDDEDISDEEDEDEEEEEDDEKNTTLNSTRDSNVNDSTASAELTEEEEQEKDRRTIFVGNLPKTIDKKRVAKLFKKFGPVESVRIRAVVPEKKHLSKKVAVITKQLHPRSNFVNAYVVFESEKSVEAALSMNGKVYDGNYLTVDTIVKSEKEMHDPKKSVFLGNLPFKVDNNTIWEFFKDCGQIESVRVIRDNKTGICKGIGYVNFTSEDAVALALELNGTELGNREIRVKKCAPNSADGKHKKSQQANKRSYSSDGRDESKSKKFKGSVEQPVQKKKQEQRKGKGSPQGAQTFAGQKAEKKKKHKVNKAEKKKKFLAEKLLAKSKKPTK